MIKAVNEINYKGYTVLNGIAKSSIENYVNAFGKIQYKTEVRVKSNPRTYLTSPKAVPFHNDHPDVDLIAWYCQEQDEKDGASVISDGFYAFSCLSLQEQKILTSLSIRCPYKLGSLDIEKYKNTLFITNKQIFFAPWLLDRNLPSDSLKAISNFEYFLDKFSKKIHLSMNDLLVINNKKMLHSRNSLQLSSRRHLTRYWLSLDKND